MTLEKRILSSWRKEYIYEERAEYPMYKVDDMLVILTTDKSALEQYKHVPRKGIIKNIADKYEIEILDKVSKEYNVKIFPSLYYVMWSN